MHWLISILKSTSIGRNSKQVCLLFFLFYSFFSFSRFYPFVRLVVFLSPLLGTRSFWAKASNRREYMDRFARNAGFYPLKPENWATLNSQSLLRSKVSLIFSLLMSMVFWSWKIGRTRSFELPQNEFAFVIKGSLPWDGRSAGVF